MSEEQMDEILRTRYGSIGITKRECFAAMALQGLIASPHRGYSSIADDAVIYADQLINALNK